MRIVIFDATASAICNSREEEECSEPNLWPPPHLVQSNSQPDRTLITIRSLYYAIAVCDAVAMRLGFRQRLKGGAVYGLGGIGVSGK